MSRIIFLIILLAVIFPACAQAVDVAPRISDREIVEKLSKLEAGQQALSQRIDDVNKRIDDLRAEMKAGQTALRAEMKAGQAGLNKRIDDLNGRLDNMNNTMLVLFGAMITLIVGIFAYIAWDRRTMMRPVLDRLDKLEKAVTSDLDINNKDGSVMARLQQALKEYSKVNPQFAEILRQFSLL